MLHQLRYAVSTGYRGLNLRHPGTLHTAPPSTGLQVLKPGGLAPGGYGATSREDEGNDVLTTLRAPSATSLFADHGVDVLSLDGARPKACTQAALKETSSQRATEPRNRRRPRRTKNSASGRSQYAVDQKIHKQQGFAISHMLPSWQSFRAGLSPLQQRLLRQSNAAQPHKKSLYTSQHSPDDATPAERRFPCAGGTAGVDNCKNGYDRPQEQQQTLRNVSMEETA